MVRSSWILTLLLALTLSGCGMADGATPQGREIRDLYQIMLIAGAVVFFLVEGAIVFAVVRYRRRDDRLPRQIHGNNLLEIVWTAIPLAVVTWLFVISWQGIQTVNAQSEGDDVRLIRVEGFQWQWAFTYVGEHLPAEEGEEPESLRLQGTIAKPPELVLPLGETVRFELQSRDVIHSFYVPAFNYKLDVVPGQTNSFEVTADRLGTFMGQCAEYCGLAHNDMHFTIRVVQPEEFEAWLAKTKKQAASGCPEDPNPQQISANNIAFNKNCLSAEAGQPISLEFINKEGVPHNVSVYSGEDAQAPVVFDGELVTSKSVTYNIEPLEEGEYFFNCKVHPTAMTGTLVVK